MTKINISNKIFNGVMILVIGIIAIIGVYAYSSNFASGNPSVFGHTADQINTKLPNGTIETLQQAFSKDVVIMNSSKNISVNDVQLGAFYSIYGNNINQYLQDVGRNTGQITCTWSGWDKSNIPTGNCTCSILGAQKQCGQSYSGISCTCLQHIGTAYNCSSGHVTQTKKYWYNDNCVDYTVTINPDTGSIGSISVGGI
jgi:hypothetical protein